MTAQLQEQEEKLLFSIYHTASWDAKLQKLEHYLRLLIKVKDALPKNEIPSLMRRAAEHKEHQEAVDDALALYFALPAYIHKAAVMVELYRELSSMTEDDRKNFFEITAGAHKGSLWRCFIHKFGALDLNPLLFGA